MPWTINSEIYPLWARSTGTSTTTCVNWIANLIVSLTFLSLTEAITRYGTSDFPVPVIVNSKATGPNEYEHNWNQYFPNTHLSRILLLL